MRKIVFLIEIVLILATACVLDNSTDNRTGMVSFDTGISKGVTASIDYPNLLDKEWTLTATKKDAGATEGQGTHEIILTDSVGPFSVGAWEFAVTDSDNLYTGTANANINVGANTVNITVHSTSNKGTLSIEECNFLVSKIGQVNYVDCYIDESRVNGTDWVVSSSMTDDGDLYVLPTITTKLNEGVHTVRLYYGTNNGGVSSDTVKVRVVNGMVTHFSIGEQEGNLSVAISFDVVEALVYDN